MKKLLMALSFLLIVFTADPLIACTAFIAGYGDAVFVGNNEDWLKRYPVELKFMQAENGKYGRVYFIYNHRTQAGINAQGFMFDFFSTPFSTPKITHSKDKEEPVGKPMNKVLEECATVEQALQSLSKYNLEFLKKYKAQIFIADRTGDSAIIEGDNILRKKGGYQVVTNFHQSKVKDEHKPCEFHRIGCDRYKTAVNMLEDRRNLSVDGFRKILQATSQDGLFIETLYSYIFVPNKGILYVYYLHHFDKAAAIDLNDELKKGNHSYDLSSLINKK